MSVVRKRRGPTLSAWADAMNPYCGFVGQISPSVTVVHPSVIAYHLLQEVAEALLDGGGLVEFFDEALADHLEAL